MRRVYCTFLMREGKGKQMSEDILIRDLINLKCKILLLILMLLINGICSFFIRPIIFLTENQILYLMSTMAQIMAGLFGLVLAAYAIIDPKLKAEGDSDEDVKESLDILRKRYFDNIIMLSVLCASTIFSCLLVLGCFEVISDKLIPILLNQSVLLCVVSVILFLAFGCSLLNPKALSNLNSKALSVVNNEYMEADLQLRPFIEFYNRLESLIFTYAMELAERDLGQGVRYDNKGRQMRMQIFQALDILSMHEIINWDIYTKIDELRRYRNALVHSIDEIKVNSAIFSDLQEMYKKINEIYVNRDDEELKKEKINELYEYGKKVSLKERDKEILQLMYNNPDITLKEMSLELSRSRADISRKISELCKKEKIKQENGKYKVLVDESLFMN